MINNSNDKNDDIDGLVVLARQRLALYEDETRRLLIQACEWAEYQDEKNKAMHQNIIGDNTVPVMPEKNYASARLEKTDLDEDSTSETSTNGDGNENQSIDSQSDSDECDDSETNSDTHPQPALQSPVEPLSTLDAKTTEVPKLSGKFQKRLIQDINRHGNNLIRIDLPLPSGEIDDKGESKEDEKKSRLHLFPAAALLSKDDSREPVNVRNQAQVVKTLSAQLSSPNDAVVIVLLIQSGRFAGGVFRREKCLAHHATARYTIRKGQGKAQSTQDGSRRPKSVGSQLRRAGEEQLKIDIKSTLTKWTEMGYINSACLIFLACPKTMRSIIFSDESTNHKANRKSNNSDGLLYKDDGRIRKIPFDVGRATFHNVEVAYHVLMGVDVCDVENHVIASKRNNVDESSNSVASIKIEALQVDPDAEKLKRKQELALELPMTPLHIAARDGQLEVLLSLLNNDENNELDVDQPAGYDCMTPLHFAAAASKVDPVTASALVSTLLLQAHADPTTTDSLGRPSYFLASHDRVRESFRKARAILGEEYCDWDVAAKVGPPLTENDLAAKKAREAEKKRRKKARQKENKAKAKAAAQEAENQRLAEEEAKKATAEAKRLRDGLSAKPTGANVCDFCQKICKGRNASKNMFRRLDYKYCGTECVNKHKRELMAAAAMARFG